MENMYQSLIILDYFSWILIRKAEIIYTKSFTIYDKHKKIWDDDNYHMLSHSCILNTCSFLEEYNNNFGVKSESQYHDRILLAKKISSP
ncbi:hypothetical protein QE417_000552 [Mucilaginibacter terrae]|uniref:Uncharacterized protein n=1 Tax=Mucilaginibacter terrae TaxID=1955052 RepID=A0ABU3GS61_9SPHI|nr:hypothetical protein [Mucilaginibacter terrae]